jgi:hypothetical protein
VLAISRELQEKCLLMAAVCNVPDLAGQKNGGWRGASLLLKACIWASKTCL